MATYVISDIHGQYNKFLEMLKKIEFSDNDHLYIIGDAINRGPEPIKLVLDIMQRENVTFLLGNHEYMMYQTYRRNDIVRRTTLINEEDEKYIAGINWYRNGGEITDNQFEDLSDIEKEGILDFFENSPIIIPNLKVGDKTFYLVHASFSLTASADCIKYMKDLSINEMEEAVWDRAYPFRMVERTRVYLENKDKILVSGHTPVKSLKDFFGRYLIPINQKAHILTLRGGHYINIDCGCAAIGNGSPSAYLYRLGCLRLDDMKEFYI